MTRLLLTMAAAVGILCWVAPDVRVQKPVDRICWHSDTCYLGSDGPLFDPPSGVTTLILRDCTACRIVGNTVRP